MPLSGDFVLANTLGMILLSGLSVKILIIWLDLEIADTVNA